MFANVKIIWLLLIFDVSQNERYLHYLCYQLSILTLNKFKSGDI